MENKSVTLTEQELTELDRRIDQRIPGFELLRASRDVAVLGLLAAFELEIDQLGLERDLSKRLNGYYLRYGGLDHGMRWIHQFCAPTGKGATTVSQSLFHGGELLNEATEYSQIWSQMSLIYRRRNDAEFLSRNVVRITTSALTNNAVDATRIIVQNAKAPKTPDDTQAITPETVAFIRTKIQARRSGGVLEYRVPQQVYDKVRTLRGQRNLIKKTMNPDWDLGGYTYRDIRCFWGTLDTLTVIHSAIVGSPLSNVRQLHDRLRIRPRSKWVSQITRWSRLRRETVEAIIDDLTYDETLNRGAGRNGHVMYQPLFKVGSDELLLSSSIVHISNFERNIWSLVSVLRPAVHDRLKNQKEVLMVEKLLSKLSSLDLVHVAGVKFVHEKKHGELDLLLLDKATRFGLVSELKWLTSSDSVQGIAATDHQLRKGSEQARLACAWVTDHVNEIANLSGIPRSELSRYDFRPIVISKDSLPSGFFGEQPVPIISEDIVDWVLIGPHKKDIRTLWNVSNARGYLPKFGVHFGVHGPSSLRWGDLKFELDGVTYKLGRKWSPEDDIEFP